MPKAVRFFNEIRTHPNFIVASRADGVWLEHVAAIEFCLQVLYDIGADNPDAIELFDEVREIVRHNCGLKAQLLHPEP
jgi:hypothetical protein